MPYGWKTRKNLSLEQNQAIASALANVDFNDPVQKRALAEIILKDLKEVINRDDIISALGVEVVEFPLGTTPQFRTQRGLKAYVHAPGSYAPRSVVAQKVQTLYTERVSVNPEIEITQLQSGRYGTIQDLKTEALDELLGRKYATIWTALIASVPTTTAAPQYLTVANAGSSAAKKAAIDSGLDYVADQQGSYPVAIVGRRSTLSWLGDYQAYNIGTSVPGQGPSEPRKVMLDNQLYPETYRGIPVIMLNQYADGYGVNLIQTGECMIIGSNTIKLGVDLPLGYAENVDADTLIWNLHIYEGYGTGVFFTNRNCRIKFT